MTHIDDLIEPQTEHVALAGSNTSRGFMSRFKSAFGGAIHSKSVTKSARKALTERRFLAERKPGIC
jgi:hypothetical protein